METRTLFAAGLMDPFFGVGGVASVNAPSEAIDVANGRIVTGGWSDSDADGPAPAQIRLGVFDSNGNPLTSFSGDGYVTQSLNIPGGVIDLVVQPDNKIVVLAGAKFSGPRVLARFNANGTLDTAFGQKTIGFAVANDIARAHNGDIIVAGNSSDGRLAVASYSSSGALKKQLITNQLGEARDVAVQSDNKVVILGTMPDPNFYQQYAAFRFTSSLSGFDSSFDGNGIRLTNTEVTSDSGAVAIDSKSRIVLAYGLGNHESQVVRLLSNGGRDYSFATSVSVGDARSLAIAASGKISVGGYLSGGSERITRFNPNGGLDTTFATNGELYSGDDTHSNAYTSPLHDVQPDGKIVTPYGGHLIRITGNTTDPTGTAVLGSDGVLRITGTEGNDVIRISGASSGLYINNRAFGLDTTKVQRIEVLALGGNDIVETNYPFMGFGSSLTTNDYIPRRIDGGKGNDSLSGSYGDDQIFGGDGNDFLDGDGEQAEATGEEPDGGDDFLDGGTGTDIMIGRLGADTVDYSFRTSAIFVDLAGTADDGPKGENDTVGADIEHIHGGKGNDVLIGNDQSNFINGNGGDDTIAGRGGNDTLAGAAGKDKIYGDAGDDFLNGWDQGIDYILDGGIGFDTAIKDKDDPTKSIEQLA